MGALDLSNPTTWCGRPSAGGTPYGKYDQNDQKYVKQINQKLAINSNAQFDLDHNSKILSSRTLRDIMIKLSIHAQLNM